MELRVRNAFRATRSLGIPDEEVKPVLRNLLKVFDKNWEPIEAEDYRALIDAYFESKENQVIEDAKKGLSGEAACGTKKLHFEVQEDQASSMGNTNQFMALDEEARTSMPSMESGIMESFPISSESRRNPNPSEMAPRDRNSISGKESSPGYSKQLVKCSSSCLHGTKVTWNNNGRDHTKQISKQNMNHMADFAEGTAVFHPAFAVTLKGSLTGNNILRHKASQCDASGSGSNDSTHCDSNFTIASSNLEEVKLLLNCDSAVAQPNFQMPDLNAVLKSLEDKYLRIDKLVTPHFSVLTLLKDLCRTYLELGTVSSNRLVAENFPAVRKVSNFHHSPRPQKRVFGASNTDIVLKEKVSKSSRFSNSQKLKNMHQEGKTSRFSNSQKLKNMHQAGKTTYDEKRSRIKLSDITRGSENVKISLIDEIGTGNLPKFTYMPHNVIYQNAYLHISLARIADEDCCSSCSGNCLLSPIPCACARETGGEYAYTQLGLLKGEFLEACESIKQNPQVHHYVFCQDCPLERSKNEYMPEKCKGHLLRKFIKECWTKCGCSMNCGNRVVQRGIRCSLQVFLTREGKGWGLRPLEDLPKGTFVCEYVGEILTNTELYERNMQINGSDGHTYPLTLDADWGSERLLKDEEALCLDASFSGNVARFINHRCNDANLIDIPVEVETPDRHYYHVAFFTKRRVSALEELSWDYGIDFDDDDHPIKAFSCCCESAFCRDRKRKSCNYNQTQELNNNEMR